LAAYRAAAALKERARAEWRGPEPCPGGDDAGDDDGTLGDGEDWGDGDAVIRP
jgi:hypothetical protein